MKKTLFTAFILILTVVSATFSGCHSKNPDTPPAPIKVRVMLADSANSSVDKTYIGEVEEGLSISLSFPSGGKVEKVYVHEGDRVRTGQLLATVNTENAENAYLAAKASLEQAEDAYNRLKKVYDQGSLPEVKFVEIKTALEKARSLEKIAKKQLQECSLRSPINGVVGRCNAKAGAALLPEEPALTVLDVDNVSVSFSVPEGEISAVSVGDEASVVVSALDNRRLQGRVSERSMSASPISHSYKVKIHFPNRDNDLLPGMVCKVHLTQSGSRKIVIPAKCVQTRPEGLSVWVFEDGMAVRRAITSSGFSSSGVIVDDGLDSDDTIIISGYQKLYTNARCEIDKQHVAR